MAFQGTPVNIDILRRTAKGDFYAELGVAEADAMWPQIAMEFDSDSDQETYPFFGAPSEPVRVDRRAATGGPAREPRVLRDYGLTVVNATFKQEIPVRRDIIEDVKLDQINRVNRQTAEVAMAFLDRRMSQVIEANGNGFDGNALYGGTHEGATSAAKDNDTTSVAATGTQPTITEFEDGFRVAQQAYRDLQTDQGTPTNFGEPAFVCMVPNAFEFVARSVLEVGPVAGQTGNSGVFKGRAKVVVNPFLTSGAIFYLFATRSAVRGILYQTREDWEFKFITEGDRWEFEDLGTIKTRSRFDFAPGDWKKTIRHTFS